MPLRHREAAERECARAEGVGLAEGEARAAKRPQGHAREPKRSELTFLRLLSERAFTFERGELLLMNQTGQRASSPSPQPLADEVARLCLGGYAPFSAPARKQPLRGPTHIIAV